MNYVSCYDRDHCSVTGLGILGALGDYDYCANRYNRYTADKLNRPDFRGNAGIVLMDFAGASNATMTYGQTYSNMAATTWWRPSSAPTTSGTCAATNRRCLPQKKEASGWPGAFFACVRRVSSR